MDDFFDDVTNEVAGTGYTRGGITLRRRSRWTRFLDWLLRRRVNVDAADITWTASTGPIQFTLLPNPPDVVVNLSDRTVTIPLKYRPTADMGESRWTWSEDGTVLFDVT